MLTQAVFPRVSISVEREEVPVRMMSPSKVADEKWNFIDKQGHGHFWQKDEIPTCDLVVVGTTWIGDEYDSSEISITEYHCRLCGQTIEPDYRLEYGPSHIPGPTTITLDINGEQFLLSPEQYAKSIEEWLKALRLV